MKHMAWSSGFLCPLRRVESAHARVARSTAVKARSQALRARGRNDVQSLRRVAGEQGVVPVAVEVVADQG